MTVSLFARQHGVAASQLFLRRKQYQEDSFTAGAAGEQVLPASELASAVNQIMRQNALLLEHKPAIPPSKQAHLRKKVAVEESNQRWCSDGFEFNCDNGEKLRVTFALHCQYWWI